MSTVIFNHFDKLAFVDKAKKSGATEDFARLVAQELESIQDASFEKVTNQVLEKELSQLATKADLRTEIKDLELRLVNAINMASNSSTNKLIAVITIVIAIASVFIKFSH